MQVIVTSVCSCGANITLSQSESCAQEQAWQRITATGHARFSSQDTCHLELSSKKDGRIVIEHIAYKQSRKDVIAIARR